MHKDTQKMLCFALSLILLVGVLAGALSLGSTQTVQAASSVNYAYTATNRTVQHYTFSTDFALGGLTFSSSSYDWLIVNQGGTNTQFKGSGSINGALDPNGSPYKFMLWADDGSPDTFRIQIWWEDSAGAHIVYDNGTNQALGGGSIAAHK